MARAAPRTVDVTIRVEKSHADQLDSIVRALESSGLRDTERHERFLIINGSVSAERLGELRKVAGVASVREDEVYKANTPT